MLAQNEMQSDHYSRASSSSYFALYGASHQVVNKLPLQVLQFHVILKVSVRFYLSTLSCLIHFVSCEDTSSSLFDISLKVFLLDQTQACERPAKASFLKENPKFSSFLEKSLSRGWFWKIVLGCLSLLLLLEAIPVHFCFWMLFYLIWERSRWSFIC